MPWSQKVLNQFALVPPNSRGNEFYGPYNKLLYTLFPADTDFTVSPQWQPSDSSKSAEFFMVYEVTLGNRPVFILELRGPTELQSRSTRQEADIQMRTRIADLRVSCPIPTLHGVSAIGTTLCFYHSPTGGEHEIQPPVIELNPRVLNDTAPEDRWACEILEEKGERKLRAIVEEIYQACAALEL